jgi:hypothetical protein
LTWNDPGLQSLEKQALIPVLSRDPAEMGMGGHEASLVRQLRGEGVYCELFPRAFPADRYPFTLANGAKALVAFERTIISARSLYERYHRDGDRDAVSESSKRCDVSLLQRRSGRLLPLPKWPQFYRWPIPQYRPRLPEVTTYPESISGLCSWPALLNRF